MSTSKIYVEKEMCLSEFVSAIETGGKSDVILPNIGKSIWEKIKSDIIGKNPGVNISDRGITNDERKKLLSICDTLDEICEVCIRDRVAEDYTKHLMLLQESAIMLGESVEGLIGEGVKAVNILENICEEIFNASQKNIDERNENIESIKELIGTVRCEIKGIDKIIHAWFLPYKYSMWDSLESVWVAASGDKEVQAVVMPIPYFERDNKGNVSEKHFELNLFLGKVPVELCTDVNLEEVRPDVIFIHNPYDQNNFVTSVFPDYYSKVLREYTDELVYIPYCLFNPIGLGAINARVPGVYFADRVILQSEEIRDMFSEFFKGFLDENNIPMKNYDEKFLGIGSPKIDRTILEYNKEQKLPDSWAEKVYDNQCKKKVILIDTHLNAVMPINEQCTVKKWDTMIEVFEKLKDVVFIWRPHPLTRETVVSLNPGFLEKYEDYIKRARSLPNVIFDDTKDAHMAMAIADGFYGIRSSLSFMFEATGRPILEYDILEETR